MSQILLVTNEATTSAILTKLLRTEGYKVVAEPQLASAISHLKSDEFNLTVLGAGKKFDPALSIAKEAKASQPAMPVVVLLDPGDTATEALAHEMNVFACIRKPIKLDEFLACVNKAVDFNDAALSQGVNLNLQLETSYQFQDIVAESAAMKRVSDMISRVAAVDVAVMISGEPGTGKVAVGRAIHGGSKRSGKTLLEVDCASEGGRRVLAPDTIGSSFASASGGTVFLRNVDGLPGDLQKVLLGVLAAKKIQTAGGEAALDVRLVSSCCGNMAEMTASGAFDAALLKHLKVIPIHVPPVKDRTSDVIPLVKHAMRQQLGEGAVLPSIVGSVTERLEAYNWPGNVTEIEEVVAHILSVCKSGTVTLDCLPEKLQSGT